MTAAGALAMTVATPTPARTGPRAGSDPHADAPAAGTRAPAARTDGARGRRGEEADGADAGAPFADLLAGTTPPSAAPADGDAPPPAPEADATVPGQLLALLDGQRPAARAAASPAAQGMPGATAAARPVDLPAAAAAALAAALGPAQQAGPQQTPTAIPTATTPLAAALEGAGASSGVGAALPLAAASAAASAAAPTAAPTAEGAAFETLVTAAAGSAAGATPEVPDGAIQAPQPLAAARPPQAAPALPPLSLPAQAGEGFDDGFGTRIAWMAEQRLGHAEIRLNPDRVGPIDVRVQLDGDQVRAEFNSASTEVRQAIEASLPRLRELLGQHGLQLGQADVGAGQPGRDGDTARSGRGERSGGGGGESEAAAHAPAPATVRVRGLIDAYA